MTFHPEVMPGAQQEVLRHLGPFATERGFYLGGGTAVAIHLGHRRSVDLDWFTPDSFPDPPGLARALAAGHGPALTVESVDRGTLHGVVNRVRVSFLEFRYPALQPTVEWPAYGCRLASLEDLACMKLSAIANRGARKDFVDLYALGRAGLALDRMLELYRERFQTRDVGHVVFSLTYFEDAEDEAMPEMLWELAWDEVKRTIQEWVLDLARR